MQQITYDHVYHHSVLIIRLFRITRTCTKASEWRRGGGGGGGGVRIRTLGPSLDVVSSWMVWRSNLYFECHLIPNSIHVGSAPDLIEGCLLWEHKGVV